LPEKKGRLAVEEAARFHSIAKSIALGSNRLDCGPFSGVQHLDLECRAIGKPSHRPTHCIDLADDMAFPNASDRGVAGHLANQIDVEGEKERSGTHSSRGKCRVDAGMATPDHNDISVIP